MPKTPKYEKYRGQPRDRQRLIALFGPEYAKDDLARLIYEVSKARGGTPFTFPPAKDAWYSVIYNAVHTGNTKALLHAARVAKRAYQAQTQPFDSLALKLLNAVLENGYPQTGRISMTLDEFTTKNFAKHLRKDSLRRRIQMVAEALGLKFLRAK